MLTRETVLEIVKLFAKELICNGIKLEKAILFGSYSTDNQNENSDIDVALVSDMFSGFGYEDRKLFSKIIIKREFVDIDTRTYPTDYFWSGDPFIEEIKRTGIEIPLN